MEVGIERSQGDLEDMEGLTFRCLTGRDGRYLGLAPGFQGLVTDGLRWERT